MGGMRLDDISRLKDEESSVKIGICTLDFSFLHDAAAILKERNIPHFMIDADETFYGSIDSLIIDKGMNIPDLPNCRPRIVRRANNIYGTLDRAVFEAFKMKRPELLVIGIDPGKRPGMAFLADGRLVKVHRSLSGNDIDTMIKRARSSYRPRNLLVRIGNGDPLSRDRIIEELKDMGISMEMVDERRTTTTKRYRDESAALKIALTKGNPV